MQFVFDDKAIIDGRTAVLKKMSITMRLIRA